MNLNSKKLTIPDLISVGVFTAIYFVLVTIATFSCALLPGVGNILLPAVAALISGSVYMLLAAKLQKFGGISIMGLVMGLFFFVSGHFVLSFAANIVCGVLADWVASRSQYRSKKVLLASYVIFSYGLTGPILPLWFMKDAYIANLTARGKDAAHQQRQFRCGYSGDFGLRRAGRAVRPAHDEKALSESGDRGMRFRMDPRAKLYLLLLANLMLFFHVGTGAEAVATGLFLLLFFLSGHTRTGIRLSVVYFGLLAIDLFVVPLAGEGVLLNLLSLVSVGVRMMLPCIITGAYAFSTTTIGELTAALRRMHVPESVIIPCAVVVRFFPTVQEDYHQIHNAMALRGIAEGKGALLLHPMQSLEYILMPLLMNGNNVAQDLSVAALTKGIGLLGTHTCMTELHLTVWDFIYPALCTLPLLWKGGILL